MTAGTPGEGVPLAKTVAVEYGARVVPAGTRVLCTGNAERKTLVVRSPSGLRVLRHVEVAPRWRTMAAEKGCLWLCGYNGEPEPFSRREYLTQMLVGDILAVVEGDARHFSDSEIVEAASRLPGAGVPETRDNNSNSKEVQG